MQGIVIQGPTDYCKEILLHYKGIENIVWSTWEDEPIKNINFIKEYIPLVLSKKPPFPGYLNVNYQIVSTYNGLKYLESKGITEILKVRGDVVINKIELFLKILKSKEMSFLSISEYPVDLVVYGNLENMLNAFGSTFEEKKDIPPEVIISCNFLAGRGKDIILTYDNFINNGVYFYMKDCLENDIEINWLKKEGVDIVQGHNNSNYDF